MKKLVLSFNELTSMVDLGSSVSIILFKYLIPPIFVQYFVLLLIIEHTKQRVKNELTYPMKLQKSPQGMAKDSQT